jgi:hypothetical protein
VRPVVDDFQCQGIVVALHPDAERLQQERKGLNIDKMRHAVEDASPLRRQDRRHQRQRRILGAADRNRAT